MPSSFIYGELLDEDIKAGAGTVLIMYYVFGTLLAICIILHFLCSIFVGYGFFVARYKKWKNAENKDNKSFWKNSFFYLKTFAYISAYALMPLILFFRFFRKNFSNDNQVFLRKNFKTNLILLITSFSAVILSNAIFVGLPTAIPLIVETSPYYSRENSEKFYKLSKDKRNILYCYFDRVDSWRVWQAFEKNPDLKKSFQDFTFYKNNLSLSDTTVSSLPSMTFGYNSVMLEKNKTNIPIKSVKVNGISDNNLVTFPGSNNVNVNRLSMEDYYKINFANFVAFWNYLGYQDVNICKFPYYGKQSPLLSCPSNSLQINQDMQGFGFKGFTGVNSSELQTFKKRPVYFSNVDDAQIWSNAVNDFKFEKTDHNVFTAIYSQQAHFDVVVKENGKFIVLHENNPTNVLRSIVDALSDLAKFIQKLKEEGVYERTTIVVTADHGHSFSWCEQDGLSSRKRAAGYAPVFMIKAEGLSNQTELEIDDSLVTTADQLAIVRKAILKNVDIDEKNKIKEQLDPLDPENRFQKSVEGANNFLLPKQYRNFYSEENDLWEREFYVMRPIDWRYMWNRKQVKPSLIRHFKYDKKRGQKDVFDSHNWEKILL